MEKLLLNYSLLSEKFRLEYSSLSDFKFLVSKDDKLEIRPAFMSTTGYDIIALSNNLNNKIIAKYVSLNRSETFSINESQLIKTIKKLYDAK